ncbi:MAG: fused MFS/spermidine synthase, partial [Verrucomicrobia bacterium]|nr:fused MFS/spermidine synthase [Verrucomicrobiota bacterium]
PFPEPLKWVLQHIVLSHHGKHEFGSPKLPAIPEAIAIHHLDARNFVEDLVRKKELVGRLGSSRRDGGALAQRALPVAIPEVPGYDYVFGDTFNDYSVPYHLTTVDFTRQLDALMSDRGMYLLNMIDRFDSGRFLAAIIATFREVFPGVYVFFCHRNLTSRGTYVVIGSKHPLEPADLSDLDERLRQHPDFFGFRLADDQVEDLLARTHAQPLTDDHAPVENLLADVVRRDYPEGLDVHHLKAGLREAEKSRLDRAIWRFERALEINPGNTQALYNLGVAWMAKGEPQQALQAFGTALEMDPDYVDVRNNAGVVLEGLGMLDEAAEQFEEIIQRRPEAVDARVNLATIRAQQGRGDEAVALLREAVRLDPGHVQARQNLQALSEER